MAAAKNARASLACKASCRSRLSRPSKLARPPRRSCPFNSARPVSQDSSFSEDRHEALKDWRSFRANLIALEKTNSALQQELAGIKPAAKAPQSWVHELILPEEGCLLLGRMKGLGLFSSSVVLLCHHDEEGSSGYILNIPHKHHLVNLSVDGELAECLRRKKLLYGGPCSRSVAEVLHTCTDVDGASEISQGLYHGGLEQINQMACLGQLQPEQVQIALGCAAWDPGQLQGEVEAGCWFVLAASEDVLKTCIFGEQKTSYVVKHHLLWQRILTAAGIDPKIDLQ